MFSAYRPSGLLRRQLLATTALTVGLAFANGAQAQTASGTNAAAVGPNATASGNESFAGGYNANAGGAGAVAIGSGANAQSAGTNQGIIDYRDGSGVGDPAAGSDPANIRGGMTGNATPINETSPAGATPSGTAIGRGSTVGAAGGVAVGYRNTAGTGTFNSTAIGSNNKADGSYGVAIGYSNAAAGRSSLSLGTNNQANGDIAVALGRQSYAIGPYSFAQGFVASAYGQDAIAIGRLSVAGEVGSGSSLHNVAIGDNAVAANGSAVALGSHAKARNSRSVAIGAASQALRGAISDNEVFSGNALDGNNAEFSVGSAGAERQITNLAGATQDTDAVNLRQLRAVANPLAATLGGSFNAAGAYTAPGYGYAGSTYTTVPDAVGAIDQYALRYDRDGSGNRLPSLDLTRGGTVGSAVSITGLAPATVGSGAVALSQMPLRYSTAASPTTANPAVPSNDVTLVGATAGRPVGLHNVAPGDIASATSTDAVNGGQLYATNQQVAGNSAGLSSLNGGLAAGTIGLVQQDPAGRAITVGRSTDGTLVDLTGTQGTRRLAGLSAGLVDSDAATIGQLRGTGTAFGGGAVYDPVTGAFTGPSYTVGGRRYTDVGAALGATNSLAVQYVPDAAGNPTGAVDLAKGGASPVALRGVGAGRLAAGSTDAVNGDQLYATNQQVAGNAAGLSSLSGGLAAGTIGLVRQDPTSRTLTVGRSTDGTLVDVGGTQGDRRLTGVAAAIRDNDAVAFGQLRGTGTAFGGGAGYDPVTGAFTVPSYSVGGRTYTDVASALGATNSLAVQYVADAAGNPTGAVDLAKGGASPVALRGLAAGRLAAGSTDAVNGDQLYATNQQVAGNTAGLSSLNSGLAAGTIGLVQQDPASRALTVGRSTDGTLVDLTGTQGTRRLAGLSAGLVDSDAATIGQLRLSGNALAAGFGGGAAYDSVTGAFTAPSYSVGGRRYTDVASALGATNSLAVQYVADASGNPTGAVDLARGGAMPVFVRGVAAGRLAAGSTDAVNGDQLSATNQQVGRNTADIASNAGGLGDLRQGIVTGSIGLVRQDPTSRAITVGAATDGALVDFANGAGTARTLTGLAAGRVAAGSADAVNGAQLYDLSQRVDTTSAAGTGLQAAVANGTIGLVRQDPASGDITVGAATAGTRISLRNGSGETRQLTGLSAGSLTATSTDAVSGAQLYETNQRVAGNATAIAANTTNLGDLRQGVQGGTIGLVQQDPTSRALTVGRSTDGTLVDVGGTQGARRLAGVSAGLADSDAATVGQLRGSGNALAGSLGGGAGYDPTTGAFTAPSYSVGGRTYTDVASALGATNALAVQYVADASGNPTGAVDLARGGAVPVFVRGLAAGRLAAGSTDAVNGDQLYATNQQVAGLSGGVANGTLGLVRQDPTSRALTVGRSTDGTLVDIGGTQGARRLAGLSAGLADGDAATVGQLRGTGAAFGGGAGYDPVTGAFTAPSYSVGGRRYTDVASALGATNSLAVQYVADASGNPTGAVDLARGGAVPVFVRGVAAGRLAAGSTDAVNGDQLYATNQQVAGLSGGLANGSLGLLRQDPVTGALTMAAATGGTSLSLTNGSGQARTIKGVAAGTLAAGSTEAVTGSQLFATNQQVATLGTAIQQGTLGLVQQDPASRGLTVGAATDGTTVAFANAAGAARTLTGIGAGRIAAGSQEAVNGGQLYGTTASLASALGGGAGIAADGTLTAPRFTVQGNSYASVGGALGSLDAAVTTLTTSGSRYVAVNSTGPAAQARGTDTVAIGPGALASAGSGVALGAGAVAARGGMGGAAEAFSGIAVASNQGAVSVGDAGAERQITNLAGGTQDTDAVNLRQLRAVGGSLAGALGGGAGYSADGRFTAPSYTIGGTQYANVGAALGAVDALGARYDVDPATGGRGQSLTLAGGDPNQPVLIRNVASGLLPTDGANLGQVTQAAAQARSDANAYTDRSVAASYSAATAYTDTAVAPLQRQMTAFGSQLADLNRQVGEVRGEARRSAAIGLAAAALRFDDRPGKLSVAAGGGVWRGETAASFGIGYTLPEGWGRVNATGVTAGRDFGVGAGASFTLN